MNAFEEQSPQFTKLCSIEKCREYVHHIKDEITHNASITTKTDSDFKTCHTNFVICP